MFLRRFPPTYRPGTTAIVLRKVWDLPDFIVLCYYLPERAEKEANTDI